MRNIIFRDSAQMNITLYTTRYRDYYEELYRDSGVWAEDQIVDGYIQESITRETEIYDAIKDQLSGKYDIIQTPLNETYIRWRSKYIFLKWIDTDETRIITHLTIR